MENVIKYFKTNKTTLPLNQNACSFGVPDPIPTWGLGFPHTQNQAFLDTSVQEFNLILTLPIQR